MKREKDNDMDNKDVIDVTAADKVNHRALDWLFIHFWCGSVHGGPCEYFQDSMKNHLTRALTSSPIGGL